MIKFTIALMTAAALSACAFDPIQYDQQRLKENAQHLRTNG